MRTLLDEEHLHLLMSDERLHVLMSRFTSTKEDWRGVGIRTPGMVRILPLWCAPFQVNASQFHLRSALPNMLMDPHKRLAGMTEPGGARNRNNSFRSLLLRLIVTLLP